MILVDLFYLPYYNFIPILLLGCVFVNIIIKTIWKWYITNWCVTDTDLCHLPLPPGTLGYPLIGETIEFVRKYDKFYKKRQDRYGNVYMTHLMGRPTVRVTGAHNLLKVLSSENSYVSSQWPPSIRKVLGPYALSMMDEVKEHRTRKRMMMRMFVPDCLNSSIPIIRSTIKHFIESWCHKRIILGYPECRKLALTIAMRSFAGFDCEEDSTKELSEVFEYMVKNMFSLPVEFPGFGLYKSLKAKKYLVQKIAENIKKVQSKLVDDNQRISILDYLLREEDEDCIYKTCESVVELLFASHDTTSSVLCSCLMYLGRNPRVLEKLRKETDYSILCDNITLQQLDTHKYLYFVIKEVLRLAPPVGAGYRKVLKSFVIEGYKIPKGWTLAYGIRDTQQTAPIYENPEIFDPDRWQNLPTFETVRGENPKERYNFAAFGGGPRFCIGQDFAKLVMKLFLLEITASCQWTLESNNTDLYYIPVPRPVDNLPLVIKKIS